MVSITGECTDESKGAIKFKKPVFKRYAIKEELIEAAKQFDTEYANFKNQFADSDQKWEALIDGEVTYESPELISIAINSYLDTGGAHGNGYVKFFNFNTTKNFHIDDR